MSKTTQHRQPNTRHRTMTALNTGPGDALRCLRKLAGLTRRQAARRAECSFRYLRAVERGELAGTSVFFGQVAAVCAEQIRRDALAGIS